jgi:hypothetical protein
VDFLLLETRFELLSVGYPPLAIERLDDDFDHDDPVAFDHLVLVAFPQARRGLVREYAVTPPKRSVNSRRTRAKCSAATATPSPVCVGNRICTRCTRHRIAFRSSSVEGLMSAFTTFFINCSAY